VGGQDVVVLSACGPTLNVVIYARRQVAPLGFTNNEAATVARLRERHYATAGEDYPRHIELQYRLQCNIYCTSLFRQVAVKQKQ